jgi:UDP-N-acetylmuramoylalanine--D-glutamate ligase
MTSYNNAKQNIYTNAKTTVYNADDAQTKPNKFYFTKKKISFGVNNADYYLRDYNGVTYLMYKQQKLLSENNLKLVGKHNMLNILACLALLEPLKLNQNKTLQAIKNFAGLEHRCQLVHFANDVKWIDDSKATNVGSVIAALDGLKVSNKLFILMGGDAKGANLTPLKAYLDKFDHELYCFGKDKKQLAKLSKNSHEYETMVEAIANLTPHTKAGDVVLLSPACASIDQFENYKQRGQIFADLAKKVSI